MAPRSAAQNEAVRAETRKRIMAAALKLFSRHGYDGTSVRMIAEESRVAQGLMYAYFPGKEALLQALFRQSMEDVQGSFAAVEAIRHPRERLRAYILGIADVIRQHLEFWRLSYGVRMQPSVLAALGPSTREWTRLIRDTLENWLREAGVDEPEVEARLLFATIDGVCQHFVLEPRRYPLDEVLHRLADRYATRRRP
ncbi:MAG: TetR family transcriptional regulator [Myxococcota bacterium]